MQPYRASFPIIVAAALLASAIECAAADLSPISIRYRDQSTIDGEKVRLGDIARIIAGEDRVVAQLETLEVARSAGFGLTRVIDTDDLFAHFLQSFASHYKFDYDHKIIHVTTRAAVLPKDSLSKMIDAFLDAQPRRPGETHHWELVKAPEEILVPVTPYTLELSFGGIRRKGKLDMNLAVHGETRVLRNIPITLNIRVEERVLVAKTKIDRDMPLGKDNVSVETRETTSMSELAMTEPEKLIGKLAKVTIVPGRIITPRLVALPPAVRMGQAAKVILHNGLVNITADAVCRQDGVPGQIISAKSLVNNHLIRVRVTEEGWLEPVPGG